MSTKTQQAQYNKNNNMESGSGNPVVWVEIPVNDLERAKKFYAALFGFKFQMHDSHGYKMAMFNAAPVKYGCGGALIKGDSYVPSYDGPAVYFSTKSIEGTLKKATQAGGKIIQGKKSIGEYGFIAFLEDTEGNRVALHTMA